MIKSYDQSDRNQDEKLFSHIFACDRFIDALRENVIISVIHDTKIWGCLDSLVKAATPLQSLEDIGDKNRSGKLFWIVRGWRP